MSLRTNSFDNLAGAVPYKDLERRHVMPCTVYGHVAIYNKSLILFVAPTDGQTDDIFVATNPIASSDSASSIIKTSLLKSCLLFVNIIIYHRVDLMMDD